MTSRRFERGLGPRNPVLGEVSKGAAEAPADVTHDHITVEVL